MRVVRFSLRVFVLVAALLPIRVAGASPGQGDVDAVGRYLGSRYKVFARESLAKRLRRIIPLVGRELGQPVGKAPAVSIMTQHQWIQATVRAQLRGLHPTDPDATRRKFEVQALMAVTPVLAKTSSDGASVAILAQNYGYVANKALGQTLDRLLAHELVHVVQMRRFNALKLRDGAAGEDAWWAAEALIEGSAQYFGGRVAERMGLEAPRESGGDAWYRREGILAMVPGQGIVPPGVEMRFAYERGERFVAAVARELGSAAAFQALFTHPPRTTALLYDPRAYIRSLGEGRTGGPSAVGGAPVRKPIRLGGVELASMPWPLLAYELEPRGAPQRQLAMQGLLKCRRGRVELPYLDSPAGVTWARFDSKDGAARFYEAFCTARRTLVRRSEGEEREIAVGALRGTWFARRVVRDLIGATQPWQDVAVRDGDSVLLVNGPFPTTDAWALVKIGRRLVGARSVLPGPEPGDQQSDWAVRYVAATRESRRAADDPAARRRLEKALADPDGDVRFAALSVLGRGAWARGSGAGLLKRLLHDADEGVWRTAVDLAARNADDTQAARILGTALADPDADLRLEALRALARHKPPPAGLTARIFGRATDKDARVRAAAVALVGESAAADSAALEGILENASTDPNAEVRLAAIRGAAQHGHLDAKLQKRILIRAAADDDVRIRAAAWQVLWSQDEIPPDVYRRALQDRRAVQIPAWWRANLYGELPLDLEELRSAVEARLDDAADVVFGSVVIMGLRQASLSKELLPAYLAALKNPGLRSAALLALSELPDDVLKGVDAAPVLRALKDPLVRHMAISFIPKIAPKQDAVRLLDVLLGDYAPGSAIAAAQALHHMGRKVKGLSGLVRNALLAGDESCRQSAVTLLDTAYEIPVAERRAVLIAALQDEDEFVRSDALSSLARTGPLDDAAIVSIAQRLLDPSLNVRQWATLDLEMIFAEPDLILPWLIKALEKESDPDLLVRYCQLIGETRDAGKAALPALRSLTAKGNERTRAAARAAIRQITETPH